MNSEIEQSIMSTLLNKPELVDTTSINTDWFVDQNYRALLEAIRELHGVDTSLLTIWGKAKSIDHHFNLDYKNMTEISRSYITSANLQSDVSVLHKLAMQRDLNTAIEKYQRNPFGDTRQELTDALNHLNQIGENGDTGSLADTAKELDYMLTHSAPAGIQTYPKLDKLLSGGLYGSMLLTIGARPSVGKTAYSVNLAYQIMDRDKDVQVDYFTLEMSKREMLNRFVSRQSGVTSQLLRNPAENLNDIQKSIIRQGIDWVKGHKLHVYDKLPTLGGIIRTIRKNASKAQSGKYVAIIDYVGLVSVQSGRDRWIEVGQITRELKVTANQFDIPIIALAQLNRGIETRTDKTPQLSDLRESGSIEQDSNVVAFLYRPNPKERDIEQLVIQKNREGSLGRIDYHFNGSEMLFQELDT